MCYKNFFPIIVFLLFGLSTKAASENENKLQLAMQLAKLNQLDKAIDESANNAANVFKFKKKINDEKLQKKNDLAAAEASTRYKKELPKIIEEANKTIINALANKFSIAELKYLIDLSRNPLYIKMKEFNESSIVRAAIDLPLDKASSFKNDALAK